MPQTAQGRGARLDARPEGATEAQRLAEVIRVLTADREQLIARIGTLERNLQDMTGSIKRQDPKQEPRQDARQEPRPDATSAVAAPPAPSPVAPPSPAPLSLAPPSLAPPKDANAGPQPQPSPAGRIGNAPAVTPDEAPPSEPAKGEFGVDVGGAANFDSLRVLWGSTKGSNEALFEGLHPVVAVRENSKAKNAELRLVVGPLPDVEAAARLCANLSAIRRYCQLVAFEGQRLAEADIGADHRPVVTPKPTPKPVPKPAAKPSSTTAKFPRLF